MSTLAFKRTGRWRWQLFACLDEQLGALPWRLVFGLYGCFLSAPRLDHFSLEEGEVTLAITARHMSSMRGDDTGVLSYRECLGGTLLHIRRGTCGGRWKHRLRRFGTSEPARGYMTGVI
eukprot:1648260-Amphidinium_carterae.2